MIRLVANSERTDEIRKALKSNGGYCPSQKRKSKDTRCLCKKFREMREGECPCGLYVKET